MSLEKNIKWLGIASIAVGSIAALLCIFPSSHSLIVALPVGFIGMICSSAYIYIDTKNEINTTKITPGIIGLLLSSAPVLIILTIIIINYFKH